MTRIRKKKRKSDRRKTPSLDTAVIRLVDALAIAQAKDDHEATRLRECREEKT